VAEERPPEVSKVYERGQTVIPKRIRDALAIENFARFLRDRQLERKAERRREAADKGTSLTRPP
jgi:bifunctional DNA-binding transcriptional regulator/antitoxin component of YhaV-PrlF toxin-antitoxin module